MENLDDHPLKGNYFEAMMRDGIAQMMLRQRGALADALAMGKGAGNKSRSKQLEDAFRRGPSKIRRVGNGVTADVTYPLSMRFADMKKMADMKIYDRPVWGYLYGELFPDIRHGFRDWLLTALRTDIDNSLNQR